MTPYIGFAGPKTAGKTTAARLLINKLRNDNITVAKFSLASPIRDMLATLLSRCLEEEEIEKYMHDQEYKEQHGKEGKHSLMRWGYGIVC